MSRKQYLIMEKTIDIDEIVRSKMGAKAKYVPGVLVSWLKRIVHQDRVNEYLWESRDKQGVEWLEECVRYLDMTLEVEGRENLPAADDGRLYTFVSNHPLGGADGVALGALIGRHYEGRFRYLVNDLLMNLPGLAPVCIPINKTGRQGRDFPRMVKAGFESDNHMLMFPAGICSRRRNGIVRDIPWTKTFITKSVETGRAVVPVHFVGRNPGRFYRADWFFRKFLKLKFNIPMLFLPDAFYHAQHKTFRVIFGKPLPAASFDKSRKPAEWAAWVREKVYQL